MPRLNCTYREFIEIITRHGFVLHRHVSTSHQIWRGEMNGRVQLVTISSKRNEPVPTGTLKSMIRQSELSANLFRK